MKTRSIRFYVLGFLVLLSLPGAYASAKNSEELRVDPASVPGRAIFGANTQVVRVTASQANETILLSANQVAVIELDSNASTGYIWENRLRSDSPDLHL